MIWWHLNTLLIFNRLISDQKKFENLWNTPKRYFLWELFTIYFADLRLNGNKHKKVWIGIFADRVSRRPWKLFSDPLVTQRTLNFTKSELYSLENPEDYPQETLIKQKFSNVSQFSNLSPEVKTTTLQFWSQIFGWKNGIAGCLISQNA